MEILLASEPRPRGQEPGRLRRLEALVLPGGESTTMSLLLESSGLLGRLGERLAQGMPAFGTCAGMILLAAEVLDGRPDQHHFGAIDISVRRNAFGRQRDSFEADLDVDGLDSASARRFRASPRGREGRPEGRGARDGDHGRGHPGRRLWPRRRAHKPVVCRQGPVLVSSFHPELVATPGCTNYSCGRCAPTAATKIWAKRDNDKEG